MIEQKEVGDLGTSERNVLEEESGREWLFLQGESKDTGRLPFLNTDKDNSLPLPLSQLLVGSESQVRYIERKHSGFLQILSSTATHVVGGTRKAT